MTTKLAVKFNKTNIVWSHDKKNAVGVQKLILSEVAVGSLKTSETCKMRHKKPST